MNTTTTTTNTNSDNNSGTNTNTSDTHDRNIRSSRPRGRNGIMFLVAVAVSLGALVTTASPASASTTLSSVTCVRPGSITVSVGLAANRLVQDGGQYASVRYFLTSARTGGTYDTGFMTPFLTRYGGTNVTTQAFSVNWGWTAVWINVAYWTGSRWEYEAKWTRIDNGVCLA